MTKLEVIMNELDYNFEKRIEEAANKYTQYHFQKDVRAHCFKAGAKFILELPELREAIRVLARQYLKENEQV